MKNLTVSYIRREDLKPHPRNPRKHSNKQIRQLTKSIRTFGFTVPVLVDGHNRIIAGHARVEAAKKLGMSEIPIIRRDDMTETQIRAYVIADNRLAENAEWDQELLAIELKSLIEIDIDFDVTVIGFDQGEIDFLIEDFESDDEEKDDHPLIDLASSPVSRLGDIWLCGRHRVMCADTRDPTSLKTLMTGETAQMVFADPPYNVRIDGHVSGRGAVRHPEFAMASGEMTEAAFIAFLTTALANSARCCVDGAVIYVCIDWRHLGELLAAGKDAGLSLLNICVWVKTNAGMGSLYRSQHELVVVLKKGKAPHVNNVELGRHGRNRSNVWNYPGMNTFGKGRMDALRMHPTVKPIAMVKDAILDCSRRGSVILDGFAGSGTTIVAAEKAGRRAFAMEIDPRYVDTAIERWQALTNQLAIHEATGCSFAEIAKDRGGGYPDGVGPNEGCSTAQVGEESNNAA